MHRFFMFLCFSFQTFVGSLVGGAYIGIQGLNSQYLSADASSPKLVAEADRLYDLNRFEDIYSLLISYKVCFSFCNF